MRKVNTLKLFKTFFRSKNFFFLSHVCEKFAQRALAMRENKKHSQEKRGKTIFLFLREDGCVQLFSQKANEENKGKKFPAKLFLSFLNMKKISRIFGVAKILSRKVRKVYLMILKD